MDPDMTYQIIVRALADLSEDPKNEDARQEAVQSLRDLAHWLDHGGFPPEVSRQT